MQDRLNKLQAQIPEDLDGVLITSSVNRRYYTGFSSSAGIMLATEQACYFITDGRYFHAAQQALKNCTVLLKDNQNQQMLDILAGHGAKRLGIESQTLTVSELEALREGLTGIEIATDNRVSRLMAMQRAVKEQTEIDHIRAAQKIADRAFQYMLGYIRPGRTETEVAAELEIFCRRNGSEEIAFGTTLASGIHSSMPHAEPGDKVIETGDFVTMDYGCTVNGYRSDMTRTIAVGPVSGCQRDVYETVLAAQLAAISAIKAGALCVEIDKAARDVIDASPFTGTFTHGLGHCIGLEVHEAPMCNRLSQDVLQAGMVTSVEPGIYIPGQYGVRIEDCVVVTADGCENICTSPKELIAL